MLTKVFTEKEKINIALSHCYFLKGKERLFLNSVLDTLQELAVLSIDDLAQLIKRPLRIQNFQLSDLPMLVAKDMKLMQAYNISLLSIEDEAFPVSLKEIFDAPPVIFYRGTFPKDAAQSVGMVGTRSPTGAGIKTALDFAKEFGEARVPVISGLARGIDAFSHKGAIEGGGCTVAVLACGVDRIYPRSNARLAAKIIETGGCILSEYPPGEDVMKYRFPQRNRIISGISRAVVIVEAPEKSGALITADFALEQGKDVFVCASVLESVQNAGGEKLYKDGAFAVNSAKEVLNDWQRATKKRYIKDYQPSLFNTYKNNG
ncbi:DNA-protecting protein DprA [Treponema phagedenis]|uniref:DNA-protecting protein DprA n=1 Tax=Treponema phagedenis TaxID=162 RepID=A0A0B7GVX4_TREPH|nr:DNA-processing protein DprA [Treponema phagedenis]NVP24555.1 DNA-protecting protein DprA [Treponema phagedenis]QEJ94747.1 DNA-protecting protein DprA [Treponema phagedenis]QEJ97684.1 DNA-protecting protein DprA [Treponema phagedenis]QEK00653.1 DNA-protecting protein DprA [Treponema phagedenis]QEK03252.1 DNA-protecting protein DprA [Treponema phagedenis]